MLHEYELLVTDVEGLRELTVSLSPTAVEDPGTDADVGSSVGCIHSVAVANKSVVKRENRKHLCQASESEFIIHIYSL